MNKRKIMTLALSICMVAILAVGGTLAYLTDTDNQKNTFTTGHVDILLDETKVTDDEGNLILDDNDNITGGEDRTENDQEYKLHPNMTVVKDPTITVSKQSEICYVGAIVTVEGNIHDLMYAGTAENKLPTIDIHKLVSGGLVDEKEGNYSSTASGLVKFDNEELYTIYQKADTAANTWVLYVVYKPEMAPGDQVVLFEQLNISADYDNAEMEKLDNMSINVDAYAVQVDGFHFAEEALVDAFEEWVDVKNQNEVG